MISKGKLHLNILPLRNGACITKFGTIITTQESDTILVIYLEVQMSFA